MKGRKKVRDWQKSRKLKPGVVFGGKDEGNLTGLMGTPAVDLRTPKKGAILGFLIVNRDIS